MSKLNTDIGILVLHGMGDHDDDFDNEFKRKVKKKLSLNEWEHIKAWESVVYGQEIQIRQERMLAAMRNFQDLDWNTVRKFFISSFSDATTYLFTNVPTGVRPAYNIVHDRVYHHINQLYSQLGDNVPIVIVAYSLGAMVISNYIWDAQRASLSDPNIPKKGIWQETQYLLNEKTKLQNAKLLITCGCNIPLFLSGLYNENQPIKPIEKPNPDFKWFNYYDNDDILGWPLSPLSDAYDKLVIDRQIRVGNVFTGWNPGSHSSYFNDNDFVERVIENIRNDL